METKETKCPIDHTKLKKEEKPTATRVAHTTTVEHTLLQSVDDDSKCPVDPSTYKYYSTTTTTTTTPMSSSTAAAANQASLSSLSELTEHSKIGTVGDEAKCPVDPSAYKHFLPRTNSEQAQQDKEQCPVTPSSYHHFLPKQEQGKDNTITVKETVHTPPAEEEGCASDTMNMSNYMPHISQQPLPDQKGHLGKHREISTIPRANSEEPLWIYPSEQMFFNAMRRKNWNPEENDMPVVVPIHNAVNEQAWQKILEWEKLHITECNQPKLLKFQGRPKDITPKARLRSWLGYRLPFDRHDWTVDRCGEKVTYVIDFYAGKQDADKTNVSFFLDVRPAVSPGGIWDRIRMSFKRGYFA